VMDVFVRSVVLAIRDEVDLLWQKNPEVTKLHFSSGFICRLWVN